MMPASGDTSTPSSKTIGNPPGEGAEQEIIKRPETITQPEPDAHSSFTRSGRTRGPAPASDLKSHLIRLACIAARTRRRISSYFVPFARPKKQKGGYTA